MKVWVIGAGSVGLLFGGYLKLKKDDHQVTYITRTKQQAKEISHSGVRFYDISQQMVWHQASAYSIEEYPEHPEHPELVLITVKQTALFEVIEWIKENISTHVPLLFLMNGLGHVEKVKEGLAQHPIFFGITNCGAIKTAMNEVQEKGRGLTKIGQVEVQPHTLTSFSSIQELITTMDNQGLHVQWSAEIEAEMWKKCVVNACINPLTALFKVRNGKLISEPRLMQILNQIYQELDNLISVIRPDADKILSNGNGLKEIEDVCRNTSQNVSSMLQDIMAGRPTEIDAITGYFLAQAQKHQIPLPVQQFIYHAVSYIEHAQEDSTNMTSS